MRIFYSDKFPQIIQSFFVTYERMPSGFAIGHPGQRRVPQLMMYTVKAAVCSEIRAKHSTQSERHLEFLNVKPAGT
jgi:hypothetical protein